MTRKLNPKSKSAHTPTPYRVAKNIDGETAIFARRNGGECCIAYGLYDENNEPSLRELDANAAFIVRACNSHEALVNAINRAIIDIEDWAKPEGERQYDVSSDGLRKLAKELKSAIAEAEK